MAKIKVNSREIPFYDCMSDTNPAITYHTTINLRAIYNALMALIDGGANGCIGGKDMTLLYYHLHHKRVNVGVANGHQMTNLRLAVMAAYIKTQSGPIIGIFHNVAADTQLDQSILSCIQMRAAKNFISDVPKCLGGLQMIETNSNHKIPIKFTAGLPYIEMRPITKAEFNDPDIPHVLMTPEGDWNPRKYDDQCDMDQLMKEIPATPKDITDMF